MSGRELGFGDLDDDGVGDLLIAAWRGYGTEGVVYIASGPVTGTEVMGAGVTITNRHNERYIGTAVVGGDVDGDGVHDLLIGQSSTTTPSAWLLLGPVTQDTDVDAADLHLVGEGSSSFGWTSLIEDLDGDGQPDLAIGANRATDASWSAGGSVYLAHGPLTATGEQDWPDEADVVLAGTAANATAASSLAAGDVNGDGVQDMLIGAPYDETVGNSAGATYLVHGPLTASMELDDADALLLASVAGAESGHSVALGDLDDDGLDDVVVGERGVPISSGAVMLMMGPVSGTHSLSAPDAQITHPSAYVELAIDVAVGDMDADGDEELLVGASAVGGSTGAAYLFDGPLSGSITTASATATFMGSGGDGTLGYGVGMSDLSGDGQDEVVLGAPTTTTSVENEGVVYVFSP